MSDKENDNQVEEEISPDESVSEESISEESVLEESAELDNEAEEIDAEDNSGEPTEEEVSEQSGSEQEAEQEAEQEVEQDTEQEESSNGEESAEEVKVSEPLTDEKLKNILEAALMAMGKPMSVAQLMSLFEGEETPTTSRVKDALTQLQEECEGRGIELKEVATGYRYQSRQEYSDWIGRLWEERPAKYSRAYLETLALIAYRQPVTRAEIEEVRGVSVSSYIIKTMLEREWIRVVGHRDVPGRPSLYATTKQFLDYFNMKSLDELPSLAEIKDLDDLNPELALEEPGAESSQTHSEDAQELANKDEIEELEVQQELEGSESDSEDSEEESPEADGPDSAVGSHLAEGSDLAESFHSAEGAEEDTVIAEDREDSGENSGISEEAREYIETSLEEAQDSDFAPEEQINPENESNAFTGESEHSFEAVESQIDSEIESDSDTDFDSKEDLDSEENIDSEKDVVEASIESFLTDTSADDLEESDSESDKSDH